MPIRINLLAEAQAAEDLRRRDPVKRTAWIGGFVIAALLLWSGALQSRIFMANTSFQKHQDQWKALEKDHQEITENVKRSAEVHARLAALARLSTNRFLWGSTFNALQQITLDPVRVTRLRGDHAYTIIPAVVPKKGDTKTRPRPASSAERITLTIDARDYGNQHDENHDKLKNAISAFPYFKDAVAAGTLRTKNWAPPTLDPIDPGRPYMVFTLELQYPEVRRDE